MNAEAYTIVFNPEDSNQKQNTCYQLLFDIELLVVRALYVYNVHTPYILLTRTIHCIWNVYAVRRLHSHILKNGKQFNNEIGRH